MVCLPYELALILDKAPMPKQCCLALEHSIGSKAQLILMSIRLVLYWKKGTIDI